ncbi:MAG: UDP-N-acetylmuramyl pentapeptide phosphotransferase/UDP-N-acetylglucosamine-1-phosphate transferase [Candidatus Woesebacteria bacterium GW2011_GWE1_45_18]|uniref:UDP-N-acetylmuramyl pentapeptide phosphotransferase/UDP-N-acetylglucosamine-1-phosphate transferase n=1 Tax=Candidatus Woesebacteria bacterium GW2011_GWE1_45_18 TaxID=1618598 RepID=A0A0G1P8B5_9BACT|nr:MAG: UDP-N-acetylmuramyl pentapeptide phosphotransferase/UDP-N-acetylglucosamine-1-phosphate transferase [Candidatus Woesebacteria bacterium GW2011_GWE1_45_18]
MSIFNLAILPGLVALAVSFLATPLVIKLAWKLGIIDDPKKSKHVKVIHTYPVPRGGGLALFFAVLVASLIFLPIDKHLKGILGGAAVLALMGILDDKYNLNPYLRLAGGFLAAAIPIAAGGIIDLSQPQINFYFLGELRSLWLLSDAFALIWIVFVMNMLNIGAKGVDGQLPGVVVVAATTIAMLSLKFSADITQWPVIILAAVTAGAYLGFLPWNFYPQKIMPGYGGSTLAGYLLAVLAILSTTKVGTLIVVLGIPLIDTGYTIVRRILARKSPVWGDRGHLHHRLLDLGWGKRRVAVFYWTISAFLGILALNLNTSSKLYTMVGIAILLGGTILWLTYRPKSS